MQGVEEAQDRGPADGIFAEEAVAIGADDEEQRLLPQFRVPRRGHGKLAVIEHSALHEVGEGIAEVGHGVQGADRHERGHDDGHGDGQGPPERAAAAAVEGGAQARGGGPQRFCRRPKRRHRQAQEHGGGKAKPEAQVIAEQVEESAMNMAGRVVEELVDVHRAQQDQRNQQEQARPQPAAAQGAEGPSAGAAQAEVGGAGPEQPRQAQQHGARREQ